MLLVHRCSWPINPESVQVSHIRQQSCLICRSSMASGAISVLLQLNNVRCVQITVDLIALALYDVVLYCDDSGSMSFEEGVSHPLADSFPTSA